MVIMNDLEWPMLSYYLIYYEKYRKIMQRTEKEAYSLHVIIHWLLLVGRSLYTGYPTLPMIGQCPSLPTCSVDGCDYRSSCSLKNCIPCICKLTAAKPSTHTRHGHPLSSHISYLLWQLQPFSTHARKRKHLHSGNIYYWTSKEAEEMVEKGAASNFSYNDPNMSLPQ